MRHPFPRRAIGPALRVHFERVDPTHDLGAERKERKKLVVVPGESPRKLETVGADLFERDHEPAIELAMPLGDGRGLVANLGHGSPSPSWQTIAGNPLASVLSPTSHQ